MEKGVIFVLHGRKTHFSTHNISLINEIQHELRQPSAIGMLEGEIETVEEAMTTLYQKGMRKLVFVPVLLFPAMHFREDLPNRIQEWQKELADPDAVTVEVAETLGTTPAVVAFLTDVIRQEKQDKRSMLIVVHGTTRYPEPAEQMEAMVRELQQHTGANVAWGALHGEPNYVSAMATIAGPVTIQPLFLSDGFLVNKIKETLLSDHPELHFLPTLENSAALKAAIVARLLEYHVC